MTTTLIWIMLYGAVYNASEWMSDAFGVPHVMTVIAVALFLFTVVVIQRRNGTAARHKLCLMKNVSAAVRLSAPLILLSVANLAMSGGFTAPGKPFETVVAVALTGLTAFAEELLFRGILPAKLNEVFQFRKMKCAIVANVLFALLHTVNFLSGDLGAVVVIQVIFAFCAGFCFYGLAERTGSIIPSTILHFLMNISAVSVMEMRYDIIWIIISLLCFLYGVKLIHNKNEKNEESVS